MKGMQKIKRGKSFAGVVLYALRSASHHKVDPVVIGGNMMGSFAKELIAEFDATKTLRSDVAKPVWHNSLRLPKNETLTDAQWSGIADDYMTRMGFSETHLRCYVLHDDEDGQHIHIIASRVPLDAGRLYLGRNENLISTRVIQQLERDYHLTKTKSPDDHNPSASPAKRKKSRNEAMLEDRTGEKCAKTIIQEAIDTLLTSQISEHEFVQQLAAQKIKAIPNRASTGKMNGFSFEYANISFKASQLGKKYSWKNLEQFIRIDIIQTMESDAIVYFGAVDASEILLPLPERPQPLLKENLDAKTITATNRYINLTMRWIEAIPWLDSIVGIVKSVHNSFLEHKNKPAKIFSASPLSIYLPPLSAAEKTTKTNVFRSRI
ncbi:relaxase/mobilization nuclease domain-containing protein [Escherichia coli]|uniref:relaxase/mobilization nuclease domain-containing protein n=1 Tax=Escherichia coli TaxID=562 RepID=UPI00183FC17A|nr:relaxase/mobilization nuclease domain-containing protein [Escherichia coli]EFB4807356.1 relaxase [Escherichia coli]EFE7815334.1 relaxase/mobilization nuclease domain-containing protein [Escherichia coli]EFH7626005.1 relaxase/mobilization nuclease domain-containing protein [Escherichia coli]EFM3268556.1 relaxase/mobilization nuclease domain-containing protein [Escherichia coli]EFM6128920.1 relaxase/mobilization nuclease domain-containing protein [Escherichia coli]